MSPDQRSAVSAALARYGARLTDDDHIARGEKVLSVQIEVSKGRLRMIGNGDNTLATYPASKIDTSVSKFVESFWYWKPTETTMPQARTRARATNNLEVVIPTMDMWQQIGGDMDPGTYGGTIAYADGRTIELKKIQPVREYVGDGDAKEVGFPFWTKEASFDASDLDVSNKDVKSALLTIGMSLDVLEDDFTPEQRALIISEALLDYGRGDEGPAGWSKDIGIPEKVKWQSGKIAGVEYIADEDEEFRNEVLGWNEIKEALEEVVDEMADESSAAAWSYIGDQLQIDLENEGYDPQTIVNIAEFGDAVAVNGDVLVDPSWEKDLGLSKSKHPRLWRDVSLEPLLEKEGYELTNKGGSIPAAEGHASGEAAVAAVAQRLKGFDEATIQAAADSLDWWQEEIPRSTSGSGSIWAKKFEETTRETRKRTRRR